MSQYAGLTLEIGREPRTAVCADCGGMTISSAGFVYRNGDPYGIYQASTYPSHPSLKAQLGIGVGSWAGEGAVADVSAFIAVYDSGETIQFSFVDPSDSPWARGELYANQLTAETARTSPSRRDFLAIAELVVRQDPVVRDALSPAPEGRE